MARGAAAVVAEAAGAVEEQRDAQGKGAAPILGARKAMEAEEWRQPGLVLERQVQELKRAAAREIPIQPRVDWR